MLLLSSNGSASVLSSASAAGVEEDNNPKRNALAGGARVAGGIGFSSSWARTHNDPFGNMVPSRYAEAQELIELCSVLADYGGTSLEFIPAIGPFSSESMELMADMSAAAGREGDD